jgi:hypothetical protein
MAEDDFNTAKRLVPPKGAVHCINYTGDTDHPWSRVDTRARIFDRDVAFIGDTPIEKASLARLFDVAPRRRRGLTVKAGVGAAFGALHRSEQHQAILAGSGR